MLFYLLFNSFFNFSLLILFGKYLNFKIIKYLHFCIHLVSVLISSYYLRLFLINFQNHYILNFGTWLELDLLKINWEFNIDSLNILLIFLVNFISLIVNLYSYDYMKNDPHFTRFLSFLSLFTFFMIFLLMANNFFLMFVGWEGVGLSSYLLINFWYTRIQANKAAMKAMIINKIGDSGLLIGLVLIFNLFGTLNYHFIFAMNYLFANNLDLICFFLFIGCMGKSAQLGLHMWLPDAMEGPTPVSALLHAATMVTAGIFLIIRCSFLFEFAKITLHIMVYIGMLTALYSSILCMFQYDLKKIIAYSTCSQLGFMMFTCGLSSYSLSLFHLFNHAFFKALLFLSAGAIIHALNDEQDIRKLGGLKNLLPYTYISLGIGSLSLMGFPFLSGFYSKEPILSLAFLIKDNYYYFIILLISSTFTVMYSLRLIFFIFFNEYKGFKGRINKINEISFLLLILFTILIFFSIFSGYLFEDLFLGIGTCYFSNSIFILPKHFFLNYIHFIPIHIRWYILSMPFYLGHIYADQLFVQNMFIPQQFRFKYKIYLLQNMLIEKFFFDRILIIISQKILNISFNLFYQKLDKGIFEYLINFLKNKLNKFLRSMFYILSYNLFFYLIYFLKIFIFFLIINLIYFFFILKYQLILLVCLILIFFFKEKTFLYFIF